MKVNHLSEDNLLSEDKVKINGSSEGKYFDKLIVKSDLDYIQKIFEYLTKDYKFLIQFKMGNSLEQWRSSIGSFASRMCSTSWTKNSSTGAREMRTSRDRKLSEILAVRGIWEESRLDNSWLNMFLALLAVLAVTGVLTWGGTLVKVLVLLNMPGVARMLYAGIKELEAKLLENKFILWTVIFDILENFSSIVIM